MYLKYLLIILMYYARKLRSKMFNQYSIENTFIYLDSKSKIV